MMENTNKTKMDWEEIKKLSEQLRWDANLDSEVREYCQVGDIVYGFISFYPSGYKMRDPDSDPQIIYGGYHPCKMVITKIEAYKLTIVFPEMVPISIFDFEKTEKQECTSLLPGEP